MDKTARHTTNSSIHDIHSRFTIWCVDTEFVPPRGVCAVPYIITVRDVKTSKVIISTTIDYNGRSLQLIINVIKEH
jgi:hypothetical protein